MDPNANLKEQLELAALLVEAEGLETDELVDSAARLAELVLALHEWIVRGGFKPAPWGAR